MAANIHMEKIIDFSTGLPQTVTKETWITLPEAKKNLAIDKFNLITPVLNKLKTGVKEGTAILNLLAHIKSGNCDQCLINTAIKLGRAGNPPSKATINRWLHRYEQNGLLGLADKNEGKKALPKEWHARALYWQQKPSKMNPGAIAQVLRAEGFEGVTDVQVRRWRASLPDDVRNKKRIGNKFYRDTQMPSRLRNCDVLEVGEMYQGDGHTIDVYLAHPNTGKPWRPELTAWIDVRSRYITGFYLTEAESSTSTLLSLSKALIDHDHVPAGLHIDNGSGYKSQMMNDEVVGFYQRFEISRMFALPGNSKGKGQVERFFRTVRDSFDKRWDSYCGHDMADEAIQKVLKQARQGKKQLPDVRDYLLALKDWIEEYHHKPHRGIDGKTPAELWAQLERCPVHMPETAVVRCQMKRTVRRGCIRLHNREYRHPELQPFNQRQLTIEYDLFNDASIVALTDDGRQICEPTLTQKVDYLPASRIVEQRDRRLKGQVKRLEKHIDEKRKRSIDNIDVAQLSSSILDDGHTVDAIEQGTTLILNTNNESQPDSTDDVEIDIYDTDYS